MIEIKAFEEITQIRMSREVGGKPLFWVAAYLIDGLLVDTGCSYTAPELADCLAEHPPRCAVNTHYHEDHIGANLLLQERFGIPIYASTASIPLIARKATLFPYQETVWGYPDPSIVLPLPSVLRTERFTFEVIPTPGHCGDHVALLERSKGWCFSGDIFPGKAVRTIRPEEDIGTTAVSLNRLAALRADRLILLTALGRIFEDGRATLKEFDAYLSDLSERAAEARTRGLSIGEIVDELFGGEDPRAVLTNGQFTSVNLVRSILGMGEVGSHLP